MDLRKLKKLALQYNPPIEDFTTDIEAYEDNFICSALHNDNIEECMAICQENDIHSNYDLLQYIAQRVFKETD